MYSVVDANASDGRHDVSRIADDENSGFVPERTAAGLDGKQFELVPVGKRFGMFGETRFGFGEALTNNFDSLSAKLLILSFRKHQTALPVFIAFKQNKDASATDATESAASDGRLVRKLWQAKPEDIHGWSGFYRLKTGELADHGEAAIGADGEDCAEFAFAVGAEVAHTSNGAAFFD